MKTTTMAILAGAALLLAGTPRAARAQSSADQAAQASANPAMNMSPEELDATLERARADLRANKIDLINKNMNFSGQQARDFWPVYNQYEAELMKLNDQKMVLVKEYAGSAGTLSDEQAKSMTTKWFDLQAKQLDLQKDYYGKFSDKITPKVATRFFQLEHRINLLTDLALASQLPVALEVPAGGGGKR